MRTTFFLLLIVLTTTMESYGQKCKTSFPEGKHLINTDEEGNNIAMEGFDLISFFNKDPKKGSQDYSVTHQDIIYLFSSEEHKASFESDPEKYMPQYGGFCAVAMFFGKTEELQTYDLYDVIDNKLYFNRNAKAKAFWDKKKPSKIIPRSNKNWNCAVEKYGVPIDETYVENPEIK